MEAPFIDKSQRVHLLIRNRGLVPLLFVRNMVLMCKLFEGSTRKKPIKRQGEPAQTLKQTRWQAKAKQGKAPEKGKARKSF
ncbi:Hypothetical protein HDN1F_15330 [gamma proteobacterium HdN1]|nr:Hypothetical protein HDN1F_15330 [gamma proteobacterium HdN1]